MSRHEAPAEEAGNKLNVEVFFNLLAKLVAEQYNEDMSKRYENPPVLELSVASIKLRETAFAEG
ncbi:hypothetical protein FACS1894202_06920 [Clostridia bacterium]|nr:hypothetical protein FACS1894202_06920 [Clostridia bacterium]